MSDSTPNLPKGHSVPQQVSQDMLRKEAKAQADRGTKFMAMDRTEQIKQQDAMQQGRIDDVPNFQS